MRSYEHHELGPVVTPEEYDAQLKELDAELQSSLLKPWTKELENDILLASDDLESRRTTETREQLLVPTGGALPSPMHKMQRCFVSAYYYQMNRTRRLWLVLLSSLGSCRSGSQRPPLHVRSTM